MKAKDTFERMYDTIKCLIFSLLEWSSSGSFVERNYFSFVSHRSFRSNMGLCALYKFCAGIAYTIEAIGAHPFRCVTCTSLHTITKIRQILMTRLIATIVLYIASAEESFEGNQTPAAAAMRLTQNDQTKIGACLLYWRIDGTSLWLCRFCCVVLFSARNQIRWIAAVIAVFALLVQYRMNDDANSSNCCDSIQRNT